MSSICAVSPRAHPNSNVITNESNLHSNHSNDSEELIKNLKLIKEKIDVKVSRERDRNGVMSMCFSNDIQDINCFNKKSLKIDTSLTNNIFDDNLSDDYSECSTLSSSPVISNIDESFGALNVSLLEQKFSNLRLNDTNRCDSPVIQINGINGFHDFDEDNDVIRAPLIRSTSLKTGKTPPDTPHRKKIVRFADVLGLDLESVRHIISDDLPTVPQSAFNGLRVYEKNKNGEQMPWFMQKSMKSENKSSLMLEFIQPSSLLNFIDRVRNNKVCLENCMVSNSAGNLSITCIIRVLNVSFEKSVTLRYTLNEWLSANEALASYIPNSCDGFSDKFSVTFSVSAGGYCLTGGQRLMFAVKYTASDEEFWDNNMGLNYSLIYRV